jgi:hypothetical protein
MKAREMRISSSSSNANHLLTHILPDQIPNDATLGCSPRWVSLPIFHHLDLGPLGAVSLHLLLRLHLDCLRRK